VNRSLLPTAKWLSNTHDNALIFEAEMPAGSTPSEAGMSTKPALLEARRGRVLVSGLPFNTSSVQAQCVFKGLLAYSIQQAVAAAINKTDDAATPSADTATSEGVTVLSPPPESPGDALLCNSTTLCGCPPPMWCSAGNEVTCKSILTTSEPSTCNGARFYRLIPLSRSEIHTRCTHVSCTRLCSFPFSFRICRCFVSHLCACETIANLVGETIANLVGATIANLLGCRSFDNARIYCMAGL
jgi:hypothetical protein